MTKPAVTYEPMTIDELARHLSNHTDPEMRWRLLMEFLTEARGEDVDTRQRLLAGEPRSTGDAHWDVLLGGLAEHLALADYADAPTWTQTPTRTWAGTVWFASDLHSARAWAIAHAPAAFRRRGIFLHPDDLHTA